MRESLKPIEKRYKSKKIEEGIHDGGLEEQKSCDYWRSPKWANGFCSLTGLECHYSENCEAMIRIKKVIWHSYKEYENFKK